MNGPGAVRVTGGRLRGRGLRVPAGARPTGARLREALFSIWSARIEGARVLDLFAGSGSVGIEAISRGAERLLLVESSPEALLALRANLAALGLGERAGVLRLELAGDGLERLPTRCRGPFDLVFADPPYAFADWPRLLRAIAPLLAPDAVVAAEHPVRTPVPDRAGALIRMETRPYGESAVSFYRTAEAQDCSA